MSGENRQGRRVSQGNAGQKGWWQRHREWVAGLSRRKKLCYRLYQVLVVLAAIIVLAALALKLWIVLPQVPGGDVPHELTPPDGSQVEFDGAQLPQVAQSGRRDGVYTFLIAGLDKVSNSTDTMLLATYDTKNKSIDAISLLRDTMINTSRPRGAQKRLNTVYNVSRGSKDLPDAQRVANGMNGLRQEVAKLTGIYADFYVLVEWEAIGELVDAIGGVWFDVPPGMNYDDPYQDLHIHQEPGYRKLSGRDAMEVIRFRKSNKNDPNYVSLGDSGRTEIQRDFLVATIKQCLKPEIVFKAPKLAEIFTQSVSTDLSVGNLLAFAQLAIGMDVENNVRFVSLPYTNTYYHAALVLAKQDELLELLNDGINPYKAAIQASDLQLMYKNKDGSYGVTNAALKDASMAVPPPPKVEEPKDPEPETPGMPEEPQPGEGDPSGQEGTEPGAQEGEGSSQGEGTSSGSGQPGGEEGQEPPAEPGGPVEPIEPLEPIVPNDPVVPGDPVAPGDVDLSGVLDPGAVFPQQAA